MQTCGDSVLLGNLQFLGFPHGGAVMFCSQVSIFQLPLQDASIFKRFAFRLYLCRPVNALDLNHWITLRHRMCCKNRYNGEIGRLQIKSKKMPLLNNFRSQITSDNVFHC